MKKIESYHFVTLWLSISQELFIGVKMIHSMTGGEWTFAWYQSKTIHMTLLSQKEKYN